MAKAIEVEDARREILARVRVTDAEEVGLGEALGRRLAVDAVAEAPFQPFDNSAMDGFAVRSADVAAASEAQPVALAIVDESRAGHPAERALGPGEAIAISTGAMLPAGADAVIRVEDTDRAPGPQQGDGDGGGAGRARSADPTSNRVSVRVAAAAGKDVRYAGEDIAAGETVLKAGALLGAAELGALATIGFDPATVRKRPTVAIVTSGDELVGPGEPLGPGAIRNSNSRTLPALARLAGAEVVSVDWAADEPGATREALARALEADVVVVSGGVSVGEHDHVKGALTDLGAEEVFWRVALKPGGPTWFGTRGGTLVFGLPGNPVSVIVTFLVFVRPALIAMAGGPADGPRTTARLGASYEKPADRAHAARARLELTPEGWVVWPLQRQGSHVLTSMLAADCLVYFPTDAATVSAGEEVRIELLDQSSTTLGR
jgi:molybdopterin molybdotransferase